MRKIQKFLAFIGSKIRFVFIELFNPNSVVKLGFGSIVSLRADIQLNTSNYTSILKIDRATRILGFSSLRASNACLSIGFHCELNSAKIQANGGGITIGNNVFFNTGCIVIATNRVEIGNGCAFGTNVSIYDHDHIYVREGIQPWNENKSTPIKIGNNCWIGCNVVILRGSIIGDNCVIAAGSIVKGHIPNHTLIYNERVLKMKDIE